MSFGIGTSWAFRVGSMMAQDDETRPDGLNGELLLESAGQRLRLARERAGLGLADVSARTKIAQRQLEAIEADRFADLAGRAYAIGFARTYSRAVGLDEHAIAQAVRDQLDAEANAWHKPRHDSFEPGDPARVPPARLAWIAGAAALFVIVLVALFWNSMLFPAGDLPETPGKEQAVPASPVPATSAADPAVSGGAVTFTATEGGVWVRFDDADGGPILQKLMTQGESFTIPPDAREPTIWTGRPDALAITVDGRPVARLGDRPANIRDVPVSAAALLARGAPAQAE